ncbi:MAG: hypothetical protein JRD47_08090 [Deltaproteobacteria bacterium]|nr:hypothetical protein [Deltaproteobacteria bacterium]MBW2318825.1 hypothetical protein [Deltaproteobacteria bacterium]MBW2601866.1 hypothetical protein [Deltaproteobacteria bacterium]
MRKRKKQPIEQAIRRIIKSTEKWALYKLDGLVKSPCIVMPDLIRHDEPVESTE